ncbi:unnamed protein product [Calicophoron daubneyi]|uniref:PITH domain-containing protein n=1 Tax=Calicophoron daubneyi TaxID=300641 RepID=A0AAV2TCL6_CALDB
MCEHTHGGRCCHSLQIENPAEAFSVYKFIDISSVECLNESVSGSGKLVFKPYEDRRSSSFVESESDEELLFNIPFTANIKLKGIIISGEPSDEHPKVVTLYRNRPFMTFSDTNDEGDQTLSLSVDPQGEIIYPLKATRFSNLHCLSVHVRANYGGDHTRVYYIGLQGEFLSATRSKIVVANYELTPNLSDHKSDITHSANFLVQ